VFCPQSVGESSHLRGQRCMTPLRAFMIVYFFRAFSKPPAFATQCLQ